MIMGRISGILFIGVSWGIIQPFLILLVFPPGTPYENAGLTPPRFGSSLDTLQQGYFLTLIGFVLCLVAGLGLLVGYLVSDYQVVGRAFVIGQLTGGAIVMVVSWIGLLFVGLLVVSFFLGILSGVLGVLLREHMSSSKQLSLDWKLSSLGLLSQAVMIPLPLLSQEILSGSNEIVIPLGGSFATIIISALVIIGVVAAVLGVIRGKITSSNVAGLLVIASFVLGAVTLTCINYTAMVANLSMQAETNGPQFSAQTQLFQVITLLLILSLAVPGLVSIRCLSPRPILSEKRLTDSILKESGSVS